MDVSFWRNFVKYFCEDYLKVLWLNLGWESLQLLNIGPAGRFLLDNLRPPFEKKKPVYNTIDTFFFFYDID